MAPGFAPATAFEPAEAVWEFLPFRFERFSEGRVLLTNMVGEHLFVTGAEFESVLARDLDPGSRLTRKLRGKHMIREPGEQLPLELLALKLRTRFHRLTEFTGLQIFVVSLRCEHSCPYCQ